MKKKSKQVKTKKSSEKSIFRQVGEVVGSIGAHIVQAKENVAGFVSDEATMVKKTAKKIAKSIKKAPPKKRQKKQLKKGLKAMERPVKKVISKTAKKIA